jgi:uncharacterized protein (UPF0333 family)
MKKHLLLLVGMLVLLALGLTGSYLYFSNFTKHIPVTKTCAPRGWFR